MFKWIIQISALGLAMAVFYVSHQEMIRQNNEISNFIYEEKIRENKLDECINSLISQSKKFRDKKINDDINFIIEVNALEKRIKKLEKIYGPEGNTENSTEGNEINEKH